MGLLVNPPQLCSRERHNLYNIGQQTNLLSAPEGATILCFGSVCHPNIPEEVAQNESCQSLCAQAMQKTKTKKRDPRRTVSHEILCVGVQMKTRKYLSLYFYSKNEQDLL